MKNFVRRTIPTTAAAAVLLSIVAFAWAKPRPAQAPKGPFKDMESFVNYIQSHHRAPFDRDSARLPEGAGKAMLEKLAHTREAGKLQSQAVPGGTNVKVNQDHNPWPKAEVGAAVDPTNGNNYVVMTNDFRENYDHEFYHATGDGGQTWWDDSMVGGADPVTGFIPLTFQSDPGVAFDSAGHSFISSISGNLIFDFTNGYSNNDTEIELAEGFGGGAYTSLLPTPIDDEPCNATFTTFNCPATLDKPLITVDNVQGSPNNGRIYVYYTLFCNANPCTDGTGTIPAFTSGIFESHSDGAGLPFSAPALVSGALTQTQFSYLVVDSSGTPHMFFDDFSNFSFTEMWESTLKGGVWVVSKNPVARFVYNGLGNINWGFRDFGSEAPGCGINGDTAYCAFSANQLAGGKPAGSPSLYLAVVDTKTHASTIHRVNNDPINDGKHHFFGWATTKADGSVYVGWYDDRNDPFNTLVQYFVGKSTDGGKTFPTQVPVSDVAYNPCTGFPGCGFFGDYTQIVAGPDGVVHAAWQDTRDGASMQIWTQSITW